MGETILFPSPNWFQVSGFTVSTDGWLIYGGPSKSLCVVEPLPADYDSVVEAPQRYQTHVLNRAHPEKIVSVDLHPEWCTNRCILTGSSDGTVKQWNFDQKTKIFKSSHSHEIHSQDKEEVAGVGYSNEVYAITVGGYGTIVKWDMNSNVVKSYNKFLSSFKPTCMSCSRHNLLNVAVGTKQGVVFVLDLNGDGKLLYKVRGHDDEIMNVSWCPQYEVIVKKSLKDSEKRSSASDRMERIRQQPNEINDSAVSKDLPEDSFDEVVQEDDMFDIYKDHEIDEFGHKKYEPEDIVVKHKSDTDKHADYLAECLKLKEEILKRKNQSEPTIESLVNALDNVNIASTSTKAKVESPEKTKESKVVENESSHMHKHLLATISKFGSIRVWSKSGKLVASCAVPSHVGKNQRVTTPQWTSLLWHKPDVILIADGKSQLLECNPLKVDCKNKLEWRLIHTVHKRGLFCIASNAPRVQTQEKSTNKSEDSSTNSSLDWHVWTVAQDRNIVCYSMTKRETISVHNTCGGFIYDVQACPYDAGKWAISVGDGAVRVWESTVSDDSKVSAGQVTTYWQNVQGKVLTVAWHPTKENLLAFATAESRVGIIDTSGKSEKPARVLISALHSAVYSLSWGPHGELYACAGGTLVQYNLNETDQAPSVVNVIVEGKKWEPSVLRVCMERPTLMLCGTNSGAVCLLDADSKETIAAAIVFNKMVYSIDWHPLQTSNCNEESPYKDLVAVCSMDKQNSIVILKINHNEDGSKHFETHKTLLGHKGNVLKLSWNSHQDGMLLSTSKDNTVRIWDVSQGACTHVFAWHTGGALCGSWPLAPQLASALLSGGSDCSLRLWKMDRHPASQYQEPQIEFQKKDKKKHKEKKPIKKVVVNKDDLANYSSDEETIATNLHYKMRASKKFLYPVMRRQMSLNSVLGPKTMFHRYLEKNGDVTDHVAIGNSDNGCSVDYLKMFGSINEVNELLDVELAHHVGANNSEAWIMAMIFRGRIDDMIQFATKKDILSPFLLSIAPCVSYKYWKDAMQLYLAQIDRLVAKGEDNKLCYPVYGGTVFRKTATLLSLHDVKGAVNTLVEAKLFKEAYLLCRTRYMDSIAEDTLQRWAKEALKCGNWNMAAVCYIALGNISEAATALGRSMDQHALSLASELAKWLGQTTLVDHLAKKAQNNTELQDINEEIEKLPSKVELLMKGGGDGIRNGVTESH